MIISATEFRKRFGEFLSKVENGETYAISRRGKIIALLTPVKRIVDKGFPFVSESRKSSKVKPESLSEKQIIRKLLNQKF